MKKLFTTSLFLLVMLSVGYGQVYTLGTSETVIGQDNANNYAGESGWSEPNQGSGFGNWTFDSNIPGGGFAGRFIGSFSSAIDETNNSFGLYANSADNTSYGAAVSLPKSMQTGDSFTVKIGVNYRDGAKGFDLRGNSNTSIVNFNVGSNKYNLAGTDLFAGKYDANTVITFTFTQNENSISWTADRTGGKTESTSGTISEISYGIITNIRFYNVSAEANNDEGGARNLYFNSLSFVSKHSIPSGSTATLAENYIAPYVTVLTGGTLNLNNHTLTISNEGVFTNNGTFTAGTGTVSFAGAGTVSGTVAFNDVDIAGGVDFGSSSTIHGSLTILAGGAAITNAPTFAVNSNLIFATGGSYDIGSGTVLWSTGNTVGKGVPSNVVVSTTNPLNIYQARDVTGNLTINSGASVVQGNNDFIIHGNFTNEGTFSFVADGAKPLIVKGNLLNQSGATITLSNKIGGDMHLEGDYQSSGTIAFNNRAIFFKGGNAQSVTGANDPINFDYLFIDKVAETTVTFNQNVIANSKFDQSVGNTTIASGKTLTIGVSAVADIALGTTLTTNGNLILGSNATSTGSLIVNGTVTGDVIAKRYMSGAETWRLVSSPVTSQTIIDVNNWTPTGGYEGGHGYDFYAYDEATAFWLNQKDGANGITTFTPGKGYLVSFQAADQTKTFTGTLNNGDVPIGITKGGSGDYAGANLIGNPYPSGIDWNKANRSLFADQFAYVYDRESTEVGKTEGYKSINGANAGAYIAANQGFFVIAGSAGSFNFTNSMKDHGGIFYKNKDVSTDIKLLVTNGSYFDETTITINESASFNRDRSDALKFYSNNINMPNLYTVSSDNKQLLINSIPNISLDQPINVGLTIPVDETYRISLSELGINFENNVLFLEDLQTGISHNLTTDGAYSFTSSSSDSPDRFLLHFGVVGIGEQDQATTLHAYAYNNRLYINNSLEQAQIAVYDLQGRLLMQQSANISGLQSLPLDLPAGVYVVRLSNAQEAKSVKINVQ